MTGNQIEYWKLQETIRHNIATESMDKPVKESQAAMNYASIDLIKEQTATQKTVQTANLASAAASYATAQERATASALNEERINTERYNQNLTQAKTAGQEVLNLGYDIANQVAGAEARFYSLWYEGKANDLDFNKNKRDRYGAASNIGQAFGLSGDSLARSGASYAGLFAN